MKKCLLMISTDRRIFQTESAVRLRQIENAKNWDEVHIIIFAQKSLNLPSEDAVSDNCFIYSTRSSTKFFYPFDAIRLGRFIIEKRAVTHITCQDSSLTAMAGFALRREFEKQEKIVQIELQVHEDLGSKYYGHNLTNKIRKILAVKYLPQADHVRVVSARIKEFVSGLGIEESKIEVRPIPIDAEMISKSPIIEDLHKKYSKFQKIVLMASRLEKEKNPGLALSGFKMASDKLNNVGLVIVGSGSMIRHLKNQVKSLGLEDKVILEPWLSQDKLASYYKTADVFLNTSLYEGYGMTLMEAKAAGLPIISTDVGIAREVNAKIIDYKASSIAEALIDKLK